MARPRRLAPILVVDLRYEGTVETSVCRSLRAVGIGLFESAVERLQPIPARLPVAISDAAAEIARRAQEAAEGRGFDIDSVLDGDFAMPARDPPTLTMDDPYRITSRPDPVPLGAEVQPPGRREYGLRRRRVRPRPRNDRPRLLRGGRRQRRVPVAGQPVVPAPGPAPPTPDAPPGKTPRETLGEE